MEFDNLKEIVRFGVPLFLMITGCLSFNKEIEIGAFLKKKVVRIVYPLIFFLIIGMMFVYGSQPFTKFWYCWMVLGVYFAIPIVNVFIRNATDREIEYFLIFFIISSAIYNLTHAYDIPIALDLNFFVGPFSYVILGYYLSRKDFNISANKIVLISAVAFVLISIYKVLHYEVFYAHNVLMLYSTLNLSIPQVIQASSVFLMFKYIYEAKSGISGAVRSFLETNVINGIMLSVSRASYGIYLLHMLFLRGIFEPICKPIHMSGFQTSISILAISTALLVISWAIIWIMGQIPYVKLISGYA